MQHTPLRRRAQYTDDGIQTKRGEREREKEMQSRLHGPFFAHILHPGERDLVATFLQAFLLEIDPLFIFIDVNGVDRFC